jgi:hypothetical protein
VLHPETRHGAAGRGRDRVANVGNSMRRFTADTAAKTRQSERKVSRDARRRKRIPRIAEIIDTALDQGDELDALAKLSVEQQDRLIGFWCGVSFGLRPILTPRALARSRPAMPRQVGLARCHPGRSA